MQSLPTIFRLAEKHSLLSRSGAPRWVTWRWTYTKEIHGHTIPRHHSKDLPQTYTPITIFIIFGENLLKHLRTETALAVICSRIRTMLAIVRISLDSSGFGLVPGRNRKKNHNEAHLGSMDSININPEKRIRPIRLADPCPVRKSEVDDGRTK